MVRKTFKPEQIINKLREAEVLLSQGNLENYIARPDCIPSASLQSIF